MDTALSAGRAPAAKGEIGFGEKFAYGLGDLASNIVFSAVATFITFFFTDVALLPAAAIGTLMMVSRLLDGVSDVIMGTLVDKTKSKHGKARPWLMWMAVPFWISAVLLFTVPELGEKGKIIYAFITYNLCSTIIYTAINIPYGTLNSLMTQNQYQRGVLNIFRMVMALVGGIGITMLTMPVVNYFGGGAAGWRNTFILFGGVATILFMMTFLFTKERVSAAAGEEKKDEAPLKVRLKALVQNKYWIIITIFAVTFYTAMGLGAGVNIYFAQYILNDTNQVGALAMVNMVPMLATLFIMAPVIKRYGKRKASMAGAVLTILGALVIVVQPSNVLLVMIGQAVKGIGTAPLIGSVFAMIADTIEYGEWKSGIRNEGLVYSGGSFGTKVGTGLGGALLGWTLHLTHYVGGAEVQSATATGGILFLFCYLPIILSAVMLITLYFFKLDNEYDSIMEDLAKRKES